MSATLFTIGFTGKNARQFFGALRLAGVRKVIDVRLKNVSQLAGFTKALSWKEYERRYVALLDERLAGAKITAKDLNKACLLCSEPTPDKCHRRLLAERLQTLAPGLEVKHL